MSNAARNREVFSWVRIFVLSQRPARSAPTSPRPKGTPKGGVVVIQEIFGVNHHIRAVTDKFAADGYLALAPRFFDHIKTGIELGYTPDTIAEAAST